ncbi:MAG: arginine deiminase, partial [Oscillibacter sp.]|nr:arginine deiminase [Oscillibacter sp.]
METGIHNTSEIGRLKKVLLHRPGQELENLMPEYLERLLFDDIPYLREAQKEHDAFAECLRQQGVEVVYLTDLVVHSITSEEVRKELVVQFLDEAGIKDQRSRVLLGEYLGKMPDKQMVSTMMAGVRKSQL